jgi:uncharacterized membrane protein YqjE
VAEAPAGGLTGSLRRLANTLLGSLESRLALLSCEAEEQFAYLLRLILYAGLMVFFIGLGVVLASLFLVLYFWPTHPLLAVGTLALVYLAIGSVCLLRVRNTLRTRPRLFADSLQELGRDRELLDDPA